jgi:hypothetical protein
MSSIEELNKIREQYYIKGYKGIIPIPSRILQSQELTALFQMPLMMLKDFSDLFLKEKERLQGFDSYYTTSFLDSTLSINNFNSFDEAVEIDIPTEVELDYVEYDEPEP